MEYLFLLLYKNRHNLLFFLLLGISLTLSIQSHSYHKSKIISSANFLIGFVYQNIDDLNKYLNLASQNEVIAQENARLMSILFKKQENAKKPKIDSIFGINEKDIVLSKVVHNSYNSLENYLTIDSGAKQNIESDMGVINDLGIVGIIDKTSPNFATITSILNVKSLINAKIKKSNYFGTLIWNGKNTGFVQLIDIPRSASIRKGDTIVTGGVSYIFPENIDIGIVDKIDKQNNYFVVNIKLFNDMTNLGYVYVLKNKKEIIKIVNKKNNSK